MFSCFFFKVEATIFLRRGIFLTKKLLTSKNSKWIANQNATVISYWNYFSSILSSRFFISSLILLTSFLKTCLSSYVLISFKVNFELYFLTMAIPIFDRNAVLVFPLLLEEEWLLTLNLEVKVLLKGLEANDSLFYGITDLLENFCASFLLC